EIGEILPDLVPLPAMKKETANVAVGSLGVENGQFGSNGAGEIKGVVESFLGYIGEIRRKQHSIHVLPGFSGFAMVRQQSVVYPGLKEAMLNITKKYDWSAILFPVLSSTSIERTLFNRIVEGENIKVK
ncbi:MAG: hypothetical protein KDC43_21915, partial [Saprospiraceae bacterium]|nr:hypothetical protein [Saprospiraceae bacterium]MCB0626498.1 hypothetical protein [Saprospiraceae bacterium]MCB0683039.1 hypothetical protein [Saprospiraceae bacterium]